MTRAADRRDSSITRARRWILVAVFLVAPATAFAGSRGDDGPPPAWLLQVATVSRQDRSAPDEARLERLKERLAAAPESDRPRLRKDLERATSDADARRGYVLYGWRTDANAKGWPTDSSKTMACFLVPARRSNVRTIEAVETGDLLRVPSAGARTLLSVSGRSVIGARHVHAIEPIGDWNPARPLAIPAPDPQALTGSITFARVSERSGGQSFRYTLSIRAAEGTAPTTAWYALRFETTHGERFGPFLASATLRPSRDGPPAVTMGFDVFVPDGTPIDPRRTTVEMIGLEGAAPPASTGP